MAGVCASPYLPSCALKSSGFVHCKKETANFVWYARCDCACHRRQPQALTAAKERYTAAIDLFIAEQFIFDKQWTAVKVRVRTQGNSEPTSVTLFSTHSRRSAEGRNPGSIP